MTFIKKSDIHEELVSLYLRLNGYFISGFIIHADMEDVHETNRTELDLMAVRFPHNREPEREIEVSDYLEIPNNKIDFIIGEVKSGRKKLQFNKRHREPENIEYVLRWMGFTEDDELITCLAKNLVEQMEPKEINSPDKYISISEDHICIRAILFHVGRSKPRNNQIKFVGITEIMEYIWCCMRPETEREKSVTKYDTTLWGAIQKQIVEYFKEETIDEPGNIKDLENYVIENIKKQIENECQNT